MEHPLIHLPFDGDAPFDWQTENAVCQQRWPDEDRFLVVTGTFTRLLCWRQGRLQRYGGNLFPVGDPASQARLGLWGVQAMLQAVEGITPLTPLADTLFARFNHHIEQVVDWSKLAQADDYAALAADILAQPDDALAVPLLQRCAGELAALLRVPEAPPLEQVCFSGALAAACLPYLAQESRL
ncbi:glucosamine kinase [Dickeya sp. CFBP 2040]|uniref:Glucosamine kinase n=1 Tax=Dickeya poaceiphila TaxID=568768 RepID=A0A5B8I6X4_9GAMM|nr:MULTISPECIES: glucosamine kinase [Dickeya]NKI75216.1 glucosamine kinase [Dickeya sp. CFBP 2040]QDX28977.1 glucosamine kinase [Dickeya poaceiphila]